MSSTAGLGRSLKRGVIFSTADTIILRLGQFAIGIVIARLIAPKEFGVFVVANTVYLIVINVSEIGVSTALVREIDNAGSIAPTVSTIAMANSAILAAGMYLAAPALASALGAPAATEAVRILTIPLLLAGPTAVPAALLMRDFQQGRKLIADLSNFLVANGVLLVLALHGGGVLALAWSRVAGQAVSCIVFYVMVSERYWPGFDLREARRLLRFGLPLAGANLAGFTLGNVDFITIGRVAGPLQLGYYNLAFNVSSWPVSVFTAILSSVTLPALARVKGGVRQLERHVAAALSALCAAAFPVTALSIVLAYPLVTVMYGARWAPSAQVLEILAVFGAIRVLIQLFSDVLVAVGKSKLLFQLQLVWLVTLVPTMVLLVHLKGGTGAGISHVAVAGGIVLPTYLGIMVRSVGIPVRIIVRPVARPLLAATVAGTVAWLAEAKVGGPPLGKLGIGIGCFSLVYLVLLGRWVLRLRTELKSLYGHTDDSAAGTRPVREAPPRPAGRHRKVTGIKLPVGHPAGLDGFAYDYDTGIDILAGFTLDFSAENNNGKPPTRSRGAGRHRVHTSADSPGKGHR